MADTTAPERLLDPDCRDGKCGSCIGGPCEHDCHTPPWMLEDAGIGRRAPARTPPADTTEGLRERYAEAAAQWALMYPLANWPWPGRTLAGADAEHLDAIARNMAAAWGRDIADRMLAVRDEELKTAHEERDAARLVSKGRTMEHYDAEAAIERVRRLCELTIAASCRVQAIDQARDTLAALAAPEGHEDAGQIIDEKPMGVHAFKQNPAATQISVCICGKWRDHHVHGADPCGCDACRTPEAAEEATTDV